MNRQDNQDKYWRPLIEHNRGRLDGRPQLQSYWHQLKEVVQLQPESVIEVGIGGGFTANYLRDRWYEVATIDIDPAFAPDHEGSVLDLPFASEAADVVICFEVLEHLPFEHFVPALTELARVSRRHVLLSLPDARRSIHLAVRAPLVGPRSWLFELPNVPMPDATPNSPHHFWEVNRQGYPVSRIVGEIESVGLKVVKNYRVPEYAYHRILCMTKT